MGICILCSIKNGYRKMGNLLSNSSLHQFAPLAYCRYQLWEIVSMHPAGDQCISFSKLASGENSCQAARAHTRGNSHKSAFGFMITGNEWSFA